MNQDQLQKALVANDTNTEWKVKTDVNAIYIYQDDVEVAKMASNGHKVLYNEDYLEANQRNKRTQKQLALINTFAKDDLMNRSIVREGAK